MKKFSLLIFSLGLPLLAADTSSEAASVALEDPATHSGPVEESQNAVDQLLERIVRRENEFLVTMRQRTPLVETYIQETAATAGSDGVVTGPQDHYFLGRFSVAGGSIGYQPLVEHTTPPPPKKGNRLLNLFSSEEETQPTFLPRGFAQMAIIDLNGFSRANYEFTYVRREFLGEVRALVFDLAPARQEPGRFVGRIWVEDRNYSIIRFNGTYLPVREPEGEIVERYFHFDSWRVNVAPGQWVPAQIYVEEEGSIGDPEAEDQSAALPHFKAQTRIWDYAASPASNLEELAQILIESESEIDESEAIRDVSPLESQRAWERQAEENVLARLEKSGFLAPPGPVDEVLNTVIDNLIISAELNVQARARVLLTTPMETFSIGHTIVISRGLIDVLPDETSLALVLADELAHIALGHPTPTQFAFHNQTMMEDTELLEQMRFERTRQELDEAGLKTIEIIRVSPYQDTSNAGLFLKALQSKAGALPRLLAANLGNQVANDEALARLAAFTEQAPELEEDKLEQIAALPLGSRIRLDPWSDQIRLVETKPIALLSPREKMPFEVTPFVLYLTRVAEPSADGQ